jgi:hypothetical protein
MASSVPPADVTDVNCTKLSGLVRIRLRVSCLLPKCQCALTNAPLDAFRVLGRLVLPSCFETVSRIHISIPNNATFLVEHNQALCRFLAKACPGPGLGRK